MNVNNNSRLGETEKIIISFQTLFMANESGSTEVVFFQFMPLDHCAHGPINNEDSGLEVRDQVLFRNLHSSKYKKVLFFTSQNKSVSISQ